MGLGALEKISNVIIAHTQLWKRVKQTWTSLKPLGAKYNEDIQNRVKPYSIIVGNIWAGIIIILIIIILIIIILIIIILIIIIFFSIATTCISLFLNCQFKELYCNNTDTLSFSFSVSIVLFLSVFG